MPVLRSLLVLTVVLVAGLSALPASADPVGDGSASAGDVSSERTYARPDFTGREHGIDVSHWQGTINWRNVKQDGYRFAIVKATQGIHYNDPMYKENRYNARRVGMVFTAYEYADPDPGDRDAIRDADHFIRVAGLRPQDMVPVLDLEETGGLGKIQLRNWVRDWTSRVEERLGVDPMIYVSPSFWAEEMKDDVSFAVDGTPLWIAHWKTNEPWVPASDWNGNSWDVWQWTSDGDVRGIRGRVDLNLLNGTSFDGLTIATAA